MSALSSRSVTSTTDRVDLIHIARGVAAVLVLFGHISIATDVKFPFFLDAFGEYPDLGVYVFFMISGFVVPWSLMAQRYTIGMFPRYMLRRLVRLDPPYFAMVAVGLAIEALRSQRMGIDFPISGTTVALHLGYLAGLAGHPWIVSVFWTLGIEFQFYILAGLTFPLLARLPRWLESITTTVEVVSGPPLRIPNRRGLLLTLLTIGVLQIVLVSMRDSAFALHTWLYYSAYFLVGIFVFAVRTGRMHWSLLVAYCVTIAGFAGVQLGWGVVIVLALLIIALPNRLPWVWSTRGGTLLNGLGHISYSLYLTHPVVVGALTRRAVDRGLMTTDVWAVLVYLSEIVLALAVATVFFRATRGAPVSQDQAQEGSLAGDGCEFRCALRCISGGVDAGVRLSGRLLRSRPNVDKLYSLFEHVRYRSCGRVDGPRGRTVSRLLTATYEVERTHFWFRGFSRFVKPFIVQALAGVAQPSILDCGCGTGANMKMLEAYGRVTGFDINATGLKFAREYEQRRLARACVTAIPFCDGAFDFVSALDVLACLDDDNEQAALAEIRRVLRPGGALVINTAALRILRGQHAIFGGELRRSTRPRLRSVLERAGFEVTRLTYTNLTLLPLMLPVRVFQRLGGLSTPEERGTDLFVPWRPINAVLSALVAIEAAALRVVDMPLGSSLLALAIKR